jgi:hypothetical protein
MNESHQRLLREAKANLAVVKDGDDEALIAVFEKRLERVEELIEGE